MTEGLLTALLDTAADSPVVAVLGVAAVLLVVESGTLVGMVLPGTTVLVGLGLWTHTAPGALPAAIAVAAAATVTGAHLGWWQGRRRRSRAAPDVSMVAMQTFSVRMATMLTSGPTSGLAAGQAAERAGSWLAGRGPLATSALLVCGHWAAAARPVLPRVAGRAGVRCRLVGPVVALSGSAWAATLVLLGNRVGPHVLTHAGWAPVVVVALLIGALALRARRRARAGAADEEALIRPSSPRHAAPRTWAGAAHIDRPALAGLALAAPGARRA